LNGELYIQLFQLIDYRIIGRAPQSVPVKSLAKERNMKRIIKILAFVALAPIMAVLTVPLNRDTSNATVDRGALLPQVKVALVKYTETSFPLRLSGITRPVDRVKLSFTVGERMISRPVDVGDTITKGQIMARLDDRKFRNSVDQASAALKEIEAKIEQILRDRKRAERLVAANALSEEHLEKTVESHKVLIASRAAAEAQLEEAKRTLNEAFLKAPFSGTITEVMLEPGEYASPGVPVLVVSGEKDIEIELEVPEASISKISIGDSVQVDLPLLSRNGVSGKVSYLGRTSIGSGRLFPVLVELAPDHRARPGVTAEVLFNLKNGPELLVPLAAVVNPGGQRPKVFRIHERKAEAVPVQVLDIIDDKVMVRGSLKSSDVVITVGHMALLEGDLVEVRP
jgi:RND family efflux transporter MFP subunit